MEKKDIQGSSESIGKSRDEDEKMGGEELFEAKAELLKTEENYTMPLS